MVIYITTNLVNGKKYLGKDSKNRESYLGSGKYLKAAIKKYGKNNFEKEIIEYCSNLDELNNREVFWLKKLQCKSDDNFYNIIDTITPCRQGKPLSKEHRDKIRRSSIGKKHTQQTRELLSDIQKERLSKKDCSHSELTKIKISSALKGKSFSDTHKKALSAVRKGVPRTYNRKAIKKLDKTTGQVLKRYEMIIDTRNDGYNPHAIQAVLSGKCKTSGGFGWRYAI